MNASQQTGNFQLSFRLMSLCPICQVYGTFTITIYFWLATKSYNNSLHCLENSVGSLANSVPHWALKFCFENYDYLREVLTTPHSKYFCSISCFLLCVEGVLKNISVKFICKKVSSYMAYSSLVLVDLLPAFLLPPWWSPISLSYSVFYYFLLQPSSSSLTFLWLLSCYLASTGISPQLKTQQSKNVKICV